MFTQLFSEQLILPTPLIFTLQSQDITVSSSLNQQFLYLFWKVYLVLGYQNMLYFLTYVYFHMLAIAGIVYNIPVSIHSCTQRLFGGTNIYNAIVHGRYWMYILSAVQVHSTTHCRFKREQWSPHLLRPALYYGIIYVGATEQPLSTRMNGHGYAINNPCNC